MGAAAQPVPAGVATVCGLIVRATSRPRWGRSLVVLALFALIVPLATLSGTGCAQDEAEASTARASARVVVNRADLVGGPRALGDVGDFLLENDRIRVVIQAPGYSRGFGIYGGSLIDAAPRIPSERGSSAGGTAADALGELFPAFFVQAVAVNEVVIVSDGSDGGPARVAARGTVGDFLELVSSLNRVITGSHEDFADIASEQRIRYETLYELAPGADYVKIQFSVTNITDDTIYFPGEQAARLEGLLRAIGVSLDGFGVPVGQVALFGATSRVFLPGVGFDVRFGLEEAYAQGIDFPDLPGLVVDWIATRGDDVSYGLVAEPSPRNYVAQRREIYERDGLEITDSSMLIPFIASGFLGVFYDQAPPELEAGASFAVTTYLVVGNGDVGSVLNGVLEIQGVPQGQIGGQVFDEASGAPVRGASVLAYQNGVDGERIYSQYTTTSGGYFGGSLPPGDYRLRVRRTGSHLSDPVDVIVREGEASGARIASPSPGRVVVHIIDASGVRLPAKATIVGNYGPERAGQDPRTFLFDLPSGEPYLISDMVPDDPDDLSTLRYIENSGYTRDGTVALDVRPGTYEVWSSRGPEYDVDVQTITVTPGQTVTVDARLTRVVDTRGWIATDLHLHTINSIDSAEPLDDRVISVAGEGVEWAVSSDHNFVTDFEPYILRNGLVDWMRSSVGLEVTTLEAGHFNGYPLRYQVGPITHGAFQWSERTPDEIFDEIRALGRYGPENTIVQVNHPRDSIIGYFDQYNRDGLRDAERVTTSTETILNRAGVTLKPQGRAFRDDEGNTTFSLDFEAIEILNGKRVWQARHYRVPASIPGEELPPGTPVPGSILLDSSGRVEWPGAVDDWFNLLNLGHTYIGVGNSDSHSSDQEAGYFRTMVYVGDGDFRAMPELALVDGLRSRRVVATNGPLIDFYVDEPGAGAMGQTIQAASDEVTIHYTLTAAPWISVSRINVIRNGALVATVPVDPDRDLASDPVVDSLIIPLDTRLDDEDEPQTIDSWFVMEVIGDRSYFPMVRPDELPSLQLTDAVGSLAGPLGLGSDDDVLAPSLITLVTALAVTNPVWVTTDARAFEAPGLLPVDVQVDPINDPGLNLNPDVRRSAHDHEHAHAESELQRAPVMFRDATNAYDVRRIFEAFAGHAH